MPVTKDQARLLVPLIIASRPYGAPRWEDDGVFAALRKVADRSLPEVIIASIRAACDAEARTPMVIASGGKAWESDAVPAEAKTHNHPPKRGQDCPHHPGQYADRCGGCYADRHGIGGYDDAPAPVPPRAWDAGDAATGARRARAALAAARHTEESP